MAKSISLKIDVKGQDELFQAQKSVTRLTEERRKLNKSYKEGKITEDAYNKQLASTNINLKASKTRVNQLNKELLQKNKIVKKSGSFTGKLTKSLGLLTVGIAGAVAGFKALTSAVTGSLEAHDKQIKAEKSLEVALGGTSEALLQQARALQQVTRYGDEQILQGQSFLAQMGLMSSEIEQLTPAILDMASAQGMNLEDAFKLVSKTMGSSTNALSRYGIAVEGAVGSQERMDSMMDSLTSKFEGQAEAMTNIGGGALQQFKNAFGDLQEQGGEVIYKFINPFIKQLTAFMPKIPALFQRVTNRVKELYNWFIELYNESLAFRVMVATIEGVFKTAFSLMKNQVIMLWDLIKGLGNTLKGALTFDWDGFTSGLSEMGTAIANGYKKIGEDAVYSFESAFDGIQEKTAKKLVVSDEVAEEVVISYQDIGKGIQTANDDVAENEQKNDEKTAEVKKKTEKTKREQMMETAMAGNQGVISQMKGALKGELMEATAGYISSVLKNVPFPLNVALAGGGMALVSGIFDKITSQIPDKFADGGLVNGGVFNGKSHAFGGIKFSAGGRLMEAEGGEAIINKKSTAMFKPLLSSINQAGGGVKFADGGILNQFQGNFNMQGSGMGGGVSGQVVVVEADVTSSQNTVQTIQSNASI